MIRDILANPFKTKSTFDPRNKDAAIEIYLTSSVKDGNF